MFLLIVDDVKSMEEMHRFLQQMHKQVTRKDVMQQV